MSETRLSMFIKSGEQNPRRTSRRTKPASRCRSEPLLKIWQRTECNPGFQFFYFNYCNEISVVLWFIIGLAIFDGQGIREVRPSLDNSPSTGWLKLPTLKVNGKVKDLLGIDLIKMVLAKLDAGTPVCRVELVRNVPAKRSKLPSFLQSHVTWLTTPDNFVAFHSIRQQNQH